MTRYVLSLLSVFIFIASTAQVGSYSTNFNSTISKAKKNKKNILVYFTESDNYSETENKYEPLLFNESIKEAALNNFNVVIISKNNSKYSSLVNKYRISYLPTYLFIDYNQSLIHKRIGIINTYEVNALLNNVLKDINTLRYFKKTEKKNPNKLDKLAYANALYQAGMDYDKYIKAYFSGLDESEYDLPKNINAFYRFVNDIYSPEFEYFVQNKEFPEENIKFTKQDYKFRVEDVITNHIIDAFDHDKQISFEDTLNRIIEHFNIEDITSLSSVIMVYYYKNINIDNNQYLSVLPTYIDTHIDIISNEEMSIYCSELIESENIEVVNIAQMWIQEVIQENPSIKNYYTNFCLLIKLGKIDEANEMLLEAQEQEEYTKEWRSKFQNFINKNNNSENLDK